MKKTIAFAAAIGIVATATPAIASDNAKPQTGIEFRDLNLATPEGQQILDQRIETAVREMCELNAGRTGSRMRTREAQRCYKTAMKSAKSQVAARIAQDRRGG